MSKVAKLTGIGVVSSLGVGKQENLRGIFQDKNIYRSKQLQGFEESITIPYMTIKSGTEDEKDNSAHFRWVLDKAIEQAFAGKKINQELRNTMPIFIGSSCDGIGFAETQYQQDLATTDNAIPLLLDGFTQISKHLHKQHNLLGQDYAFNTACTASANALLSACNSIKTGQHEYALVIGMETFNITTSLGFYGMQLLADDVMRPFDKNRNGLTLGEGCSVLLLQAAQAEIPGLTLCGGASHCDTYSISASNPDGSMIAEVMQEALDKCDVRRSDIKAIKAHGTASPLNDTGEAAGMGKVFKSLPPFFSLKSYIGHTLGACGAIETALVAASLEQGKIPASGGFKIADDTLGAVPLTQTQEIGNGYFMLNFFGFGGNNCSLIIHTH